MAPNHAIASRYGRDAQLETFVMSNVCPQRATLNQGPWEALEKMIAQDWSQDRGEVWVVVGPIFGSSPKRLKGVAQIPKSFFSIVVDADEGRVRLLPIIMKQTDKGIRPVVDFITTVDEIEARSGLDLFSDLPDALEDEREAENPDGDWDLHTLLVPTYH